MWLPNYAAQLMFDIVNGSNEIMIEIIRSHIHYQRSNPETVTGEKSFKERDTDTI